MSLCNNIDNVENFKKEVVDSGKPHVLFYQRGRKNY